MRMRLSLAALFLFWPALLHAQAGAGSPADLEAIRAIESQWETAWNRHDVAAMVALGTPDADWVNLAGEWFKGRDAFAKSLEGLHSGKVKGSTWKTAAVQARFLTTTIAVVHVYFSSSGERNPDGSPMPPRRGVFTRVEAKRDGHWLIVASQATKIVPPATAMTVRASNQHSGQ